MDDESEPPGKVTRGWRTTDAMPKDLPTQRARERSTLAEERLLRGREVKAQERTMWAAVFSVVVAVAALVVSVIALIRSS